MNIQPITNHKFTGIRAQKINKTHKSPSFKGYEQLLKNACRKTVSNDRQAEEIFTKLYKSVCEEKDTQKQPYFDLINQLYEKGGFRGMLNELWKAFPIERVDIMLKKHMQDYIDLLLKDGKPIFQLFNMGRFGVFDSKTSPNDVKVLFNTPNQNEIFEFSLSKEGGISVGQTFDNQSIDTEFYSFTGAIKKKILRYANFPPEVTYYNKDGSESFFKNLFLAKIPHNMW